MVCPVNEKDADYDRKLVYTCGAVHSPVVYVLEFVTCDQWMVHCFCVPGDPLGSLYVFFFQPSVASSETSFAKGQGG